MKTISIYLNKKKTSCKNNANRKSQTDDAIVAPTYTV